jgi:DNA-directed RNA polymerase alpha subunit
MRSEIVDRIKSDIMKLHKSGESFEGINGVVASVFDEINKLMILGSKSIYDAGFSPRVLNCLISEGFDNLYEVSLCSEIRMHGIPNMGKKSLSELIAVLSENNLKLNGRW